MRTPTVWSLKACGTEPDEVEIFVALISCLGILIHLTLKYLLRQPHSIADLPLFLTLVLGGIPMSWNIVRRLIARDAGADLLAGISIVAAVFLHEYLVGSILVLMLSGGSALERMATRRASSVLAALVKRAPQLAHLKRDGVVSEAAVGDVKVGNTLVVFPHEICPVDGVVTAGNGAMDEAYLTGEPFQIAKTPGCQVFSGAINMDVALTIRALKPAVDSRYAQIVKVMEQSGQSRPRLRRIADWLGAWYAPLALSVAAFAWFISGSPQRFLAVLVIATPCPLIIAIPVAIIGAISVAAKRGIVIKDPKVLEQVSACHTFIFDKTGTLTYGRPQLTEMICVPTFQENEVLQLAASMERYSKHPLADAIKTAALNRGLVLGEATEIAEHPGQGMCGRVAGHLVRITGRSAARENELDLPPLESGLECLIFVDDNYAASFRFHDAARIESKPFVAHLGPRHQVDKIILLSGDRGPEVRYLAARLGIGEVYFGKNPQEKVAIVRDETARQNTFYLGDGINDAPALLAATVGVAFGQNSDITAEAADAVILESSLAKVDELIHIGKRMRTIALQSAIGGMALSGIGMILATAGYLPPLAGAVAQEVIDLAAVVNALRMALPSKRFTDF